MQHMTIIRGEVEPLHLQSVVETFESKECLAKRSRCGWTRLLRARDVDAIFLAHVDALRPSLEKLLAMTPVKATSLPKTMPLAGVYLFSEGTRPLYVGRSNAIRRRIGRHCRPGATDRMAAFAFRLAREVTGNLIATYKRGEGSRSSLMENEAFIKAFTDAKARIRSMDLRFVEESDPTRQALLEIYVSVVLSTPYNDFDTH